MKMNIQKRTIISIVVLTVLVGITSNLSAQTTTKPSTLKLQNAKNISQTGSLSSTSALVYPSTLLPAIKVGSKKLTLKEAQKFCLQISIKVSIPSNPATKEPSVSIKNECALILKAGISLKEAKAKKDSTSLVPAPQLKPNPF